MRSWLQIRPFISRTPRRRISSRASFLEGLESRVLLSFAPADLSGTWTYAAMGAEGTIQFDSANNVSGGSLQRANGTTITPQGTYAIDATGVVTVTTNTSVKSGAMNSTKDLTALTMTGSSTTNFSNSLSLLVKHTATAFSNADLSGTWNLFVNGDGGGNTGLGSMSFDGNGNITGGSNTDVHGVSTITGGNYTVSSTGQVTVLLHIIQDDGITPADIAVTGWINDGKDTLAFNPPDIATAASNNESRLMVLVHDTGVYSNASLNTTWEFVGDGYKGALTFDGTGAFTGAGIDTNGATMALSGTYAVATSGTFTVALNVVKSAESIALNFQGALNGSRNFGTMEQVPFDNGTDSSRDSLIMMVDTGALSATPGIPGNWTYASASQDGSIQFDDAGNVVGGSLTDTLNTTSIPAGTYTLGAGGGISIVTSDTRSGARNSPRDVIAIANTSQGSTLSVLVNGGTAVFSNGDLTGTWNMDFNGDSAGNNGGGTVVFDGQGNITGGTVKNGAGTQAVTGGNYAVNADGTCSVNVTTAQGTLNLVGAMNASKDVLALSPTDLQSALANHSTDLILLVKTGGTYSNATLAGTWTLETENGSGTVILDGAGHVSGSFSDAGGGPAAVLSGTYSVAAGGTFSANVINTQGTSHHTSAFTGAINAGHNVMIENQIGASVSNGLAVLVFAANHAPTFSAVTPLNVAAVGHDFAISRAMLLAASNAKDSDANPLQFTITALGTGALALNGAPVSVPAAFTAADTLTWTPPAGTGGTFTAFSVTVTDGLTPPTIAVPVAINTIVPETYAAGTLNNTWIVSGDTSEGTIIFDGAGSITGGSITDDTGSANALSGTYIVSPSGAVTLIGGDTPTVGAINATRDVAVLSDGKTVVLVDSQRGSNYSNADLTGTWNVIADGQDPSSTAVGTVVFNGAGLVTGGSVQTGTASFTVTGTYTVSADGTFAVTLTQTGKNQGISLHGALNDSKDLAAVSADDLQAAEANSNPLLMLFVHATGAYTNADAKGTWFVTGGNTSGYVTLDGAGHIKNGSVVSTHGNGTTDTLALTGTYAVAANGKVTIKLVATGGGAAQSLTLTGAMNAGRNMIVENQVGPGSSENLIIFTSTQDHAPTLKTISPQATAIGTLPFDITYAQLLASSNAADADKDTLQFQVTSLGAGAFTLDGNPAAAPFLISPGDTLEWTPPATANGSVAAFSVKIFDGILASATAVPVVVKTVLPPTVSITANKPAASELNNGTTNGIGQFTISRAAGDINQSLTVHYTIGGTALNGTDYTTITDSFTFTPRQTSAPLSIIAIADHLLEGAETVTLTLVPDSVVLPTYKLNPAKTLATVTIADVLASPAPLAGALRNTPFAIAYADLLAAVGVVSAGGQPITFKITAVKSGTLKKNGVPVVPNSTTLATGDPPLSWTPPANTIGTKAAFTMTASDGISVSTVLMLSVTIT